MRCGASHLPGEIKKSRKSFHTHVVRYLCKRPTAVFRILLFAAIGGLTACSRGLPNDKQEYVGYWKSEQVLLQIQVNGAVMYIDKRDATHPVTVQGNISKFIDNDFFVGMKPFDTQFKVSKPPYQDGAVKKMIVNDIELQNYELPPEGNKTFKL